MREWASDQIEQLLAGQQVSTEKLLWAILLSAIFFATLHLVTMLVTKWGDSNASLKSLIFSIIVHISAAIGVAMLPYELSPQTKLDPRPERMQIQEIKLEGEERVEHDLAGNTPIWDQVVKPLEKDLARNERSPLELDPLKAPERDPKEDPKIEANIPDLAMRPELPTAAPELQASADPGPKIEAVAPSEIDDPTTEARPEFTVPSTSTTRSQQQRSGLQKTTVERLAQAGSVDRISPDVRLRPKVAGVVAAPDPSSFLARADQPNEVRTRAAPVPTMSNLPDGGVDASRSGEGTSGAAPTSPNLTRTRSRLPSSQPAGGLERLRPERRPTVPNPIAGERLAVRDSVSSPAPIDGLKPNIVPPKVEMTRPGDATRLPATYRLRSLARREAIARKFGGTDASERAVELSLRWLALHQSANGSWDASRFGSGQVRLDENGVDRQRAGLEADAGVTALAILAFLGAGYTHEDGQYADEIDRALRWLVSVQGEDGFLGAQASHYAKMYCHGMASYALAEAYGMRRDPAAASFLREPLQKALDYITSQQNPDDGGWRYLKGQSSDMSMFGWQLMALKSAEIAGIPMPTEVRTKMIQFLKARSLGKSDGLATYRVTDPPSPPTPSMTAESLFCKQMLGMRRDNPASTEAIAFLLENAPRRSEYNEYYWYYGTLAMYQYGSEPWQKWNDSLRDLLVDEQIQTGDNAGSWDPLPPWGPYGGRVYSTALCTLCLEVYYRFLPLYQMGERFETIDE